jgi:hypothetical protein
MSTHRKLTENRRYCMQADSRLETNVAQHVVPVDWCEGRLMMEARSGAGASSTSACSSVSAFRARQAHTNDFASMPATFNFFSPPY